MSRTFRISTALPLLLLLAGLAEAPLAAAEREGARVVVELKDGDRCDGELIAVRPDALLVLDRSGQDKACRIDAISRLTVGPRRQRAFRAALIGGLVGSAAGATIGVLKSDGDHRSTVVSAIVFAPLGGIIGAFAAGVIAGSGERTYALEGMTEERLEKLLTKLRASARVPS